MCACVEGKACVGRKNAANRQETELACVHRKMPTAGMHTPPDQSGEFSPTCERVKPKGKKPCEVVAA